MDEPEGRVSGGTRGDEGFFRALVEQAGHGLVVVDDELRIRYANPAARDLTGYSVEELIGRPALSLLTPDSTELAVDALSTLLPATAEAGRRNNPVRITALRRDGGRIPVDVLPAARTDPAAGGLVLQLTRADGAQAMSDAVSALLVGSDHSRVLALLASLVEHDISESSASLGSGWNGQGFTRVAGRPGLLDLRSPSLEDRRAIGDALAGPNDVVDLAPLLSEACRRAAAQADKRGCWLAKVRTGDGGAAVTSALVVWHPAPGPPGPVYLDDLRRAVGFAELGLRWEAQQRMLAWDARHDRLTGLVNRVELQDQLERGRGPRAVLYCDLDEFKPVNDRHGHRRGDAVLVAVARRLEVTAAPHMVARLGGDEFAVVMDGVGDHRRAVALGQRLIESVRSPIDIQGLRAGVGLSVGAAVDSSGTAGADALLDAADAALHRAKVDGKGRVAWTVNQAATPA